MAQERSIEVKVGVLILVSLVILGGFVFIMGGVSFEKKYVVYADFDNPGGLQAGAPVRMAGIKVGKVEDLSFRSAQVDPKTGKRALVRVKAAIESRFREAIHDDADFYVTTQGVLGEQFLAIQPGSIDKPLLQEGAAVRGIDPPRLDLFLAKAFELLETAVTGIRNNRELISDIATNTAGLLKGLNSLVTDNKDRVNRIITNLEALSDEARLLTHNARVNYVDNPRMMRTIDNMEHLTSSIRRDSEPMLRDAREAVANLNRVSATVGDPKEQAKLRKMLDDLAQLATRANTATADAQAIVAHIRSGKGTVGSFVMDEEIYDNMQEMVRDLKHNPWKFLWRE
jgi:phospholipid/cholesterol/gamma-HCH transport system substrate-binding protein